MRNFHKKQLLSRLIKQCPHFIRSPECGLYKPGFSVIFSFFCVHALHCHMCVWAVRERRELLRFYLWLCTPRLYTKDRSKQKRSKGGGKEEEKQSCLHQRVMCKATYRAESSPESCLLCKNVRRKLW